MAMKNRTLTIVLVTALVLIGAQVAWAAIPNGNGHIVGCYQTTGGSLRVVSAASGCDSATEKSLVWDQAAGTWNKDVAYGAPVGSPPPETPLLTKFGVSLTYRCYLPATSNATVDFLVNVGTNGVVNGTYTVEDHDDSPTPSDTIFPSQQGFVGKGVISRSHLVTSQGWSRLEGTLLVKTATGTATITFHLTVNTETQSCQLAGVLTPA